MSGREAFGPNLRRVRVQRGISLETIAAATKISVDLLAGLEQNDLTRWPTGIYARAYVRAYVNEIGVDAEAAVDDFCRWFPQGDRRAERVVRDQAALMGHSLQWKDDLIGQVVEADRRSSGAQPAASPISAAHRGRVVAALADAAVVVGAGLTVAALTPIGKAASFAVCAFLYHGITLATIGCTPAVWAIDIYLANRHPSVPAASSDRALRLLRSSERVKV